MATDLVAPTTRPVADAAARTIAPAVDVVEPVVAELGRTVAPATTELAPVVEDATQPVRDLTEAVTAPVDDTSDTETMRPGAATGWTSERDAGALAEEIASTEIDPIRSTDPLGVSALELAETAGTNQSTDLTDDAVSPAPSPAPTPTATGFATVPTAGGGAGGGAGAPQIAAAELASADLARRAPVSLTALPRDTHHASQHHTRPDVSPG